MSADAPDLAFRAQVGEDYRTLEAIAGRLADHPGTYGHALDLRELLGRLASWLEPGAVLPRSLPERRPCAAPLYTGGVCGWPIGHTGQCGFRGCLDLFQGRDGCWTYCCLPWGHSERHRNAVAEESSMVYESRVACEARK